jgi:hypothetical protein
MAHAGRPNGDDRNTRIVRLHARKNGESMDSSSSEMGWKKTKWGIDGLFFIRNGMEKNMVN